MMVWTSLHGLMTSSKQTRSLVVLEGIKSATTINPKSSPFQAYGQTKQVERRAAQRRVCKINIVELKPSHSGTSV